MSTEKITAGTVRELVGPGFTKYGRGLTTMYYAEGHFAFGSAFLALVNKYGEPTRRTDKRYSFTGSNGNIYLKDPVAGKENIVELSIV